jgi:5-methylcytosine-specific restriction endonuclease McrA
MKPRKWTNDKLIEAIKRSRSWLDLARNLGICHSNVYTTIKPYVSKLNLDTSHFLGQAWHRGEQHKDVRLKTVEKAFSSNKKIPTHRLKLRLFSLGLLKPVCNSCGITQWLNKPAPLELDHIDGDRTNNKLENLRILCANCHAQTDTYCGKNIKKKKLPL